MSQSYKSDKEGSLGNFTPVQKSIPIHYNNDKISEKLMINQDASPSQTSGNIVSRYRSDFEEIEFLGKGKKKKKINVHIYFY